MAPKQKGDKRMKTITPYVSNLIFKTKAFAILFVVAAHCSHVGDNADTANSIVSQIWFNISGIGVPIFFFLSGFLIYFTKKDFKTFFLSKLKNIVLPWVVCGTVVYLYVYLRSTGISLLSLAKWLIGDGTYLYFLTDLMILYLITYFFRKNKNALWICFFVSVTAKILESLSIVDFSYSSFDITFAMFFFSLGLLAANYDVIEKIIAFSAKYHYFGWIIYFAQLIIKICLDFSYPIIFSILFKLLGVICSIGLAENIRKDKFSRLASNIGKNSFTIYLIHMPLAGIVSNVCNSFDFALITIVRPFFVLAVVYLIIVLLRKVINNLPKAKQIIYPILGLR